MRPHSLGLAFVLLLGCQGEPSEVLSPAEGLALEERVKQLEEGLEAMQSSMKTLQPPLDATRMEHPIILKHVHKTVRKDCMNCHHKGLTDPFCFTCHEEEEEIYHKVCIECHTTYDVPTSCRTCHDFDVYSHREHYVPVEGKSYKEDNMKVGALYEGFDATQPGMGDDPGQRGEAGMMEDGQGGPMRRSAMPNGAPADPYANEPRPPDQQEGEDRAHEVENPHDDPEGHPPPPPNPTPPGGQ